MRRVFFHRLHVMYTRFMRVQANIIQAPTLLVTRVKCYERKSEENISSRRIRRDRNFVLNIVLTLYWYLLTYEILYQCQWKILYNRRKLDYHAVRRNTSSTHIILRKLFSGFGSENFLRFFYRFKFLFARSGQRHYGTCFPVNNLIRTMTLATPKFTNFWFCQRRVTSRNFTRT